MSRLGLVAATAGILLAGASTLALAQTIIQTQPQPQTQALAPGDAPFVARANISVANNSAVPETVAGTGVTPFQLMPHQQARLEMNVAPPPVATAPGSSVPVRFEYSVGQGSGPQCHGTIDMSLNTQGAPGNPYAVTNCVAHSLGTNGADCNIAVSAENAMCQGGLAFSAR
ncbi:MAG TPA: hypothetical protein VGL83_12680 [Stellaceae bacterium]|jgi:hypothetical protein